MGGRFALTWANFQKNVESIFGEVKLSQDFSDVTLVGEDFEVEAHRLVLSAGSQVFQQVLKKAKHPHPLIFLNGTKKVEIEAVLSFLYHGEVTISQESLEQFLLRAKELKIRGVLEDETEELLNTPKESPKWKRSNDATKPENPGDTRETAEIGEVQHSVPGKKSLIHSHFSSSTKNEATCNLCGKGIAMTGGTTSGLWRHMEKKHKDVTIEPHDTTLDEQDDFETDAEDSKLWNKNKSNVEESAHCDQTKEEGVGNTDKDENVRPKQEQTSRSKVWLYLNLNHHRHRCHFFPKLFLSSSS